MANEFWVQLSDGKIRKDKKVRSVGYEGMGVEVLPFCRTQSFFSEHVIRNTNFV